MKNLLQQLFILVLSCMTWACRDSIDQAVFEETFKRLSAQRLKFRINMKALGDSGFVHRHYAYKIMEEVQADSVFDRFFAPQYLAYHDSLREEMRRKTRGFETQWTENKPLIRQWEMLDMQFDGIVQKIKSGDLGEAEGLDSLQKKENEIVRLVGNSDSLNLVSKEIYWQFRKTHEEYKYNLNNLKALYIREIYK